MGPKRLVEAPPPAETDSSEEETDSETVEENGAVEEENFGDDEEGQEDEEDEEDEEEEENSSKRPNLSSPAKISKRDSDSDSDTESDNSAPSPSVSDFTIKPSKSIEESPKPKKKALAKAKVETTGTPVSLKRPAEVEQPSGKEAKKRKVAGGEDDEAKKGSGINRLWSDEDEIAILKGMIDYQSKKGSDPYADMTAFLEFIKTNLHVDVHRNQLMDKVRRLRKKYYNNAERGEDPVFAKPHEQKTFELSKKIWGTEANANGVDDEGKSSKRKQRKKPEIAEKKEKVIANGELEADPDDFWIKYPCLNESLKLVSSSAGSDRVTCSMKQLLPMIGSSKANELEKKWEELQVEEMELFLRKNELIQEQGKLVVDSIKSSLK
ncbi:hypothetical protein UlMin_022814 [Ulmus minor]